MIYSMYTLGDVFKLISVLSFYNLVRPKRHRKREFPLCPQNSAQWKTSFVTRLFSRSKPTRNWNLNHKTYTFYRYGSLFGKILQFKILPTGKRLLSPCFLAPLASSKQKSCLGRRRLSSMRITWPDHLNCDCMIKTSIPGRAERRFSLSRCLPGGCSGICEGSEDGCGGGSRSTFHSRTGVLTVLQLCRLQPSSATRRRAHATHWPKGARKNWLPLPVGKRYPCPDCRTKRCNYLAIGEESPSLRVSKC